MVLYIKVADPLRPYLWSVQLKDVEGNIMWWELWYSWLLGSHVRCDRIVRQSGGPIMADVSNLVALLVAGKSCKMRHAERCWTPLLLARRRCGWLCQYQPFSIPDISLSKTLDTFTGTAECWKCIERDQHLATLCDRGGVLDSLFVILNGPIKTLHCFQWLEMFIFTTPPSDVAVWTNPQGCTMRDWIFTVKLYL